MEEQADQEAQRPLLPLSQDTEDNRQEVQVVSWQLNMHASNQTHIFFHTPRGLMWHLEIDTPGDIISEMRSNYQLLPI